MLHCWKWTFAKTFADSEKLVNIWQPKYNIIDTGIDYSVKARMQANPLGFITFYLFYKQLRAQE